VVAAHKIMTNIAHFKYDTIKIQRNVTYNLAYTTLKQCGRGSIVGDIVSYIPITLIRTGWPFKIMPRTGTRRTIVKQLYRVTNGQSLPIVKVRCEKTVS